MGIMHNIPGDVEERLVLMLSGQCSTGGAMPVVKPFAHNPGHEVLPDETEYRSDDCLWLFPAIIQFIKETGKKDFLNKTIPYADKGEDSVINHLKRAIEFNLQRSGKNGLPCGLHADWNDCLQLRHDGESVFVAFQLRLALNQVIEIARLTADSDNLNWANQLLIDLDDILRSKTWDGKWYLRAIRADGFKFGSAESEEGKIFLNTQSWAIISGHASNDRAQIAMGSVNTFLATPYGLQVCDPAYEGTDFSIVKAVLFNKGMKENGGIFNHTQGWAVMAETMLGNGNREFEYYKNAMPASYNDNAELREVEPYVHCQSTQSKYILRFGKGRVPWLSGTATWAYFSAAHYILGIRPELQGLVIDPCIPSEWNGFKAKRIFRGMKLNITVENPNHSQKGVDFVLIDGVKIAENWIAYELLEDNCNIRVVMS